MTLRSPMPRRGHSRIFVSAKVAPAVSRRICSVTVADALSDPHGPGRANAERVANWVRDIVRIELGWGLPQ